MDWSYLTGNLKDLLPAPWVQVALVFTSGPNEVAALPAVTSIVYRQT